MTFQETAHMIKQAEGAAPSPSSTLSNSTPDKPGLFDNYNWGRAAMTGVPLALLSMLAGGKKKGILLLASLLGAGALGTQKFGDPVVGKFNSLFGSGNGKAAPSTTPKPSGIPFEQVVSGGIPSLFQPGKQEQLGPTIKRQQQALGAPSNMNSK